MVMVLMTHAAAVEIFRRPFDFTEPIFHTLLAYTNVAPPPADRTASTRARVGISKQAPTLSDQVVATAAAKPRTPRATRSHASSPSPSKRSTSRGRQSKKKE